ncbi:MAG: sigma-70 family RNA polymerase sigma factor [Gammaproteobacteria bacterium]|nr:sigma-70 family RNA polymerase sigma factor [Gammaproteobacteria bacterium]
MNSIETLLQAAGNGDTEAFDELYARVYAELRSLARAVRQGKGTETLNTTALVHEAYLHLLPSSDLDWKDRSHFFGVAARAMRQVLAAAARRRLADKRGGGAVHVELADDQQAVSIPIEQIVGLDEALNRLEAMSERQARIVEFRFFAGFSVDETAEMLGLGTATVKRDWRSARAWLTQQLGA